MPEYEWYDTLSLGFQMIGVDVVYDDNDISVAALQAGIDVFLVWVGNIAVWWEMFMK